MSVRIIEKFEGVDEEGLTFEQSITKDVHRYIKALEEWYDNDGHTDLVGLAMWVEGMYEARLFSEIMHGLRFYHNKHLDQMTNTKLAEKLKCEIVDVVTKYDCKKKFRRLVFEGVALPYSLARARAGGVRARHNNISPNG